MTTKAWAHLPNAAHVDRILASVKKNPEKWSTAWDVAGGAAGYEARDAAWDAAGCEARDAAWDAAWNAVQGAVWGAAGCEARGTAWDAAWNAVQGAVWGTVLALIAWDDCAYILELPEDALKVLRAVGNEQAILLSAAAHALRETS